MAQARRLHELLQEPQEPFHVDTFLIERGYSANLLDAQESLPLCWPRNSSRKYRPRLVGTDDFTRKDGGFCKGLLSKLLYRKFVKRTIKCDRKALKEGNATASRNRERTLNSRCFVEEPQSETKKHSPVSVLEMHSYVASPADSNDKEEKTHKFLSLIDSPKKAFNILEELLKLAYDPSTNCVSESARDDLKAKNANGFEDWDSNSDDSTTTDEEGSTSFSLDNEHEHSEAVREIVISELEKSMKNWESLKIEMSRELGTEIENVIFEEIMEELIFDFLKPNCTNERCKV